MQTLKSYLAEKVPAYDRVLISYRTTTEAGEISTEDPGTGSRAEHYLWKMDEIFCDLKDCKPTEIITEFLKGGNLVFSMTMDEFDTLFCDLADEEEE